MIKIVSTSTCSFLLYSSFCWAVIGYIAWKLIDLDFDCDFLINVFANEANWILPSYNIVGDSIDFIWSFTIYRNSIQVRILTVTAH